MELTEGSAIIDVVNHHMNASSTTSGAALAICMVRVVYDGSNLVYTDKPSGSHR